jgi:hypothetical protein
MADAPTSMPLFVSIDYRNHQMAFMKTFNYFRAWITYSNIPPKNVPTPTRANMVDSEDNMTDWLRQLRDYIVQFKQAVNVTTVADPNSYDHIGRSAYTSVLNEYVTAINDIGAASINIAPPWTPTSLPNLVAWYDAQNTASIILNGPTVAQWNDQSGHGHNVLATAGMQPTYNATGLNGKPTMIFGGSQILSIDMPAGLFSEGISIATISNMPTSNQWGIVKLSGMDGSGYANPYSIYSSITMFGGGDSQTYDLGTNGFERAGVPELFGLTYVLSTNQYNDYSNGSLWSTLPTSNDIPAHYGSKPAYCALCGLQYLGGFGQFATGNVSEVVLCALIADADRQKLEGYLAWKWGLEGNLPTNHPFYSGPPDTNGKPILP